MNADEEQVAERAESALRTNAEAYRLAQELSDLRRALEWYADPDTWTCLEGNHVAHCGPEDCAPAIDADNGDVARRALGQE